MPVSKTNVDLKAAFSLLFFVLSMVCRAQQNPYGDTASLDERPDREEPDLDFGGRSDRACGEGTEGVVSPVAAIVPVRAAILPRRIVPDTTDTDEHIDIAHDFREDEGRHIAKRDACGIPDVLRLLNRGETCPIVLVLRRIQRIEAHLVGGQREIGSRFCEVRAVVLPTPSIRNSARILCSGKSLVAGGKLSFAMICSGLRHPRSPASACI
ncbi:MAG: hypothetical protein JWN14_2878 [Chthonomonadales bacterium]|nr:hypothetical protein [Chthonomonadales bacterium]